MQTALLAARYGYWVLGPWVLAEQLGLPLPSAPLLLAAGALAARGQMHLSIALALVVVAALSGDFIWYRIGRSRGGKTLGLLCRLSLEPESCKRRTENSFGRWGLRALLVAKFIPWLSAVASPVAGVLRLRLRDFLIYDALGTLLWAGTYLATGYLLGDQLASLARLGVRLGTGLAIAIPLAAFLGYILWKYLRHKSFLRHLKTASITPEELKRKLEAGEPLAILDLRHPLDLLAAPYLLPRAKRLPLEQLQQRMAEIPRDREVVLYCTCPSQASSARTALKLRRLGITRVRPLAGGYFAWRDLGYPLEQYDFSAEPAHASG